MSDLGVISTNLHFASTLFRPYTRTCTRFGRAAAT